jgi:hypothetical protein
MTIIANAIAFAVGNNHHPDGLANSSGLGRAIQTDK